MSHPNPLHDPENVKEEDIVEKDNQDYQDFLEAKGMAEAEQRELEMDDDSDVEIDQRLDAESRDLDRQADRFDGGIGFDK